MLEQLSKNNKIPIEEFGIAGLKDRHAVTTQHLTIPAERKLVTTEEENFSLKLLGYMEHPLKLGDLKGNRFSITVRSLRKGEIDGVYQKAEEVRKFGVPNYFDSQRFGSVINGRFVVKYLVQKQYEEAVKTYMTAASRYERIIAKKEKKMILENWPRIEGLKVTSRGLQRLINEYVATKDWIKTYRKIPSNIRELLISAYQSYLWNECVKRLLIKTLNRRQIYSLEYNVGTLIFFKKVTDKDLERLPKKFQTISDEIKPTEHEKKMIDKVLEKEDLTIPDFNIKKDTGNFFKTHARDVIVKPKDLILSKPFIDKLNDKGNRSFFAISLSFELPKGSYATIITKKLFNM